MQSGSSRLNAWIFANSSSNLLTKSSSKDFLREAFGVVESWQRKSVMVFGTKVGLKSKLSSWGTIPMLVSQCNENYWDDKRVFCFGSCSWEEIILFLSFPFWVKKKSGKGIRKREKWNSVEIEGELNKEIYRWRDSWVWTLDWNGRGFDCDLLIKGVCKRNFKWKEYIKSSRMSHLKVEKIWVIELAPKLLFPL